MSTQRLTLTVTSDKPLVIADASMGIGIFFADWSQRHPGEPMSQFSAEIQNPQGEWEPVL